MVEFAWNAEEALKLLNRGYRIVLTQDGLGDITAVAVPKGESLNAGLKAWRDYNPECETTEDIQRSVFEGPNKFSGGGRGVAQALHCLTEKAVFNRLPDGEGGFFTPPGKSSGAEE
jgi:hypothetical protein